MCRDFTHKSNKSDKNLVILGLRLLLDIKNLKMEKQTKDDAQKVSFCIFREMRKKWRWLEFRKEQKYKHYYQYI